MADEVRVISSSIVQAANHRGAGERIELSPWDLQFLLIGYMQKGLLFHKPKPDLHLQEDETESTQMIHHLKNTLSRSLDYFPILAGRLATTEHHEDDTFSFSVDCNNAGALFIHAKAEGVTISDIIEPVYVPAIIDHSFFPLNGVKNCEGITNPLLVIQITDLEDGIFIGCTINHAVADGTSFWHFFNLWSEISKAGSIHLSESPVFQRWFPDHHGTHLPIRISRSCLKQINEVHFVEPALQERVFHFTKENIAKLKAKAKAEIGITNNMISSLQALYSHLWRCVIRNKSCDSSKETICGFAVGARQRLQELPDQYFGNACIGSAVTMKAKELLEQGIGKVAWQINRKIAAVNEESFKKSLESWIASPSMVTFGNHIPSLVFMSSSPRFNMYGNDFGWGKPIAVRCAGKIDGNITFLGGAEEGSIDIAICLSSKTLEAMANDKDFMDTVKSL